MAVVLSRNKIGPDISEISDIRVTFVVCPQVQTKEIATDFYQFLIHLEKTSQFIIPIFEEEQITALTQYFSIEKVTKVSSSPFETFTIDLGLPLRGDGVFYGFFSSGSTGHPKLIIHKKSSLEMSAKESLSSWDKLFCEFAEGPLISSLPFYHVGGFLNLLRTQQSQREFLWCSSKEVNTIVFNSISANIKVTVIGVPAQFKRIMDGRKDGSKIDDKENYNEDYKEALQDNTIEHNLLFYAGGDRITPEMWDEYFSGFYKTSTLIATYGQTESAGALFFKFSPGDKVYLYPSVTLSKEEATDGIELLYKTERMAHALFQNGHMEFLSHETMKESGDLLDLSGEYSEQYRDREEELVLSASHLRGENLNFFQSDFIKIKGRKDQQFQCGGELISPLNLKGQLEQILNQLSFAHEEIFVKGIPDQVLGMIPVAFIKNISEESWEYLRVHHDLFHSQKNNPAKLRYLAQYPKVFKGIKPSLQDFITAFNSSGIKLP